MTHFISGNLSGFHNGSADNDGYDEEGESELEPTFYTAIDVPMLCLGFLIAATNLSVLVLVLKKRCLHSYTNAILASLAGSDFLTGLVGIPVFIGCSATYQDNVCIASVMFHRFLLISTVLHLLLIASDRYYTIILSIKYPHGFTKRRACACIIFIWIFSPVAAMIQLTWINVHTTNVNENASSDIIEIEKYYFSVCFALFYAFPFLLMTGMYIRILITALHHMRMIRKLQVCPNRKAKFAKFMREYRGSILFFIMLVVFGGCWMSYFLMGLQHHFGEKLFVATSWSEHVVVFLRFAASLFNPVLYALCKPDFRFAIKSLLRKLF